MSNIVNILLNHRYWKKNDDVGLSSQPSTSTLSKIKTIQEVEYQHHQNKRECLFPARDVQMSMSTEGKDEIVTENLQGVGGERIIRVYSPQNNGKHLAQACSTTISPFSPSKYAHVSREKGLVENTKWPKPWSNLAMSPKLKKRVWKCKTCLGANDWDDSICGICSGNASNNNSLEPPCFARGINQKKSDKLLRPKEISKSKTRPSKIDIVDDNCGKSEGLEQRRIRPDHFFDNTVIDSTLQTQPVVLMKTDNPDLKNVSLPQ